MKKLLILLVSVFMLIGAVGCTSTETPNQGSEEVTGEITLRIAHNMDFVSIPNAVLEAGERLNERYAAEGRDLVIKFETDYQTIDWTEYHNNVVFAHKSNDAPDIYSLSGDVAGFVNAGTLMDISSLVSDRFVENVFTPFTVDEKVYGMPFDLPVRVLYYNKQVLADYGWTAEQITALPQDIASGEFTFEDFMALATELTNAGAVDYGMVHRPGAGSDFLDIFNVLGGEYFNEDGKLVVDSEGLLRFFQFTYDNANTTNITPKDLNQQGWTSINTMVGDGSAFSYYGPMYASVYVAGSVDQTPAELVDSIGFALFPVSEYNDTPFVTAAPQGMGISTQTEYPEICMDLFEELANDSYDMLALHASTILTLSSVKEANSHEHITTNPVLNEVTYMPEYAQFVPTIDGGNVYNSELHKQIVLLELGQVEPEQALADFKTQIELNVDAEDVVFE